LLNGIAAAACIAIATSSAPVGVSQGWVGYLVCHLTYYSYLQNRKGSELNKLLKYTSILLLLVAVYLLILLSVYPSPAKP
ncbi:MAG: hypothetical protein K2I44_11525, partial [Muribaculaceae bacterium]|nr:hypothetical protein [Muribaculaceae bacterium]